MKNVPNFTIYRDSYLNAVFKHIFYHFNVVSYIGKLKIKPETKIDKEINIFIYEIAVHQTHEILRISSVIPDELKKKGIKVSLH